MKGKANTTIRFWGNIFVRGQLKVHSEVTPVPFGKRTSAQHDYFSSLLQKDWDKWQWKWFDFSRINLHAYRYKRKEIEANQAIENSGLEPNADLYVWGVLNISAYLSTQTKFSQKKLIQLERLGEVSHQLDCIVLQMQDAWKLDEKLGLTGNETINRFVAARNGLSQFEFENLQTIVNGNLPNWQFESFDTRDLGFAFQAKK
jgi:hypothetical protein